MLVFESRARVMQLSLEDYHGPDVEPEDAIRFKGQKGKLYEIMRAGGWFTLRELSRLSGALETSVSARIREFPHEKRLISRGLYQYRLVL